MTILYRDIFPPLLPVCVFIVRVITKGDSRVMSSAMMNNYNRMEGVICTGWWNEFSSVANVISTVINSTNEQCNFEFRRLDVRRAAGRLSFCVLYTRQINLVPIAKLPRATLPSLIFRICIVSRSSLHRSRSRGRSGREALICDLRYRMRAKKVPSGVNWPFTKYEKDNFAGRDRGQRLANLPSNNSSKINFFTLNKSEILMFNFECTTLYGEVRYVHAFKRDSLSFV